MSMKRFVCLLLLTISFVDLASGMDALSAGKTASDMADGKALEAESEKKMKARVELAEKAEKEEADDRSKRAAVGERAFKAEMEELDAIGERGDSAERSETEARKERAMSGERGADAESAEIAEREERQERSERVERGEYVDMHARKQRNERLLREFLAEEEIRKTRKEKMQAEEEAMKIESDERNKRAEDAGSGVIQPSSEFALSRGKRPALVTPMLQYTPVGWQYVNFLSPAHFGFPMHYYDKGLRDQPFYAKKHHHQHKPHRKRRNRPLKKHKKMFGSWVHNVMKKV